MDTKPTDISKFFAAGISYKKSDVALRGLFAVSRDQYRHILSLAPAFKVDEVFVLSTCNRTEIYGIAENIDQLIDLLCTQTKNTKDIFLESCYLKSGQGAIEHLFSVAAGLDSQILGDHEIVGQIKQAVKYAKEHQRVGAFTERLFNCVLQSSKAIKNQTGLSSGTVSVSFAAVEYLKQALQGFSGYQLLLVGTGKIGRNTCRNLIDYLGTKEITLVNRTNEKSTALAYEMGLKSVPLEHLGKEIDKADVIIVATNAQQPVIRKKDLIHSGRKWLIDLSIPNNIEPSAKDLAHIDLVNVDDLSKINDTTLQKRQADVPKAKLIVEHHMAEFMQWHDMRRHVPVLRAVKSKLNEIYSDPLFSSAPVMCPSGTGTEEKIQKIINSMATKMRRQNTQGCHYIEAIHEFISN